MAAANFTIKMRPEADGFGFIYGFASSQTMNTRVDLLPPHEQWTSNRGRSVSYADASPKPHATLWTVFVGGSMIGTADSQESALVLVREHILAHSESYLI